MRENRTKSTLINTSFAIISRIVSMLLGFIQKTIFIRILGISYTGVSGLFNDILMVLSLAELGISSAIAYALYKPIAQNDYKHIAQISNFLKIAYRFISFIVFALGVCILPFLDYIVKDVPDIRESIKLIFFLYVLNSASTYLLAYKNTLLVAAQKQYIVSNIQLAFNVVGTIIECIILIIFKNFILYLILLLFISLSQNITINYVATKKYPQLRKFKTETICKEDRLALFKDIRALLFYKISNVILTGTDSSIISYYLGTSQVGILGNYRTIRGYITTILDQFYNSLNPSLGNMAASEKKESQFILFKRLNFGTFWVACFCATSFFCLFNKFIMIWLENEQWIMPTLTVGVYVFEFYISTMMHSVGAFRIANGLFVQTKYVALIKAILNLCISIAFVKYLGILGVLLGTVISQTITQFWYEPIIIYKRVFDKHVAGYFIVSLIYLLITVICCGIVIAIMSLLPAVNMIGDFIIRICLCIAVPNGMIILIFRKTNEYRACIDMLKMLFSSIKHRMSSVKGFGGTIPYQFKLRGGIMKIGRIYRRLKSKFYSKVDPVNYARKLGVNMQGKVFIYGRVFWSTEPWIITLGNNVHITDGVKFITHDGGTLLFRNQVPDLEVTKPITIGSDVYIGNNVIILPGVHIGNRVVIGAGAVVSRDIQDNAVAVGVPARVIKTADEYFEKLKRESLHLGHLKGREKDKALMEHYNYKGDSKGYFF